MRRLSLALCALLLAAPATTVIANDMDRAEHVRTGLTVAGAAAGLAAGASVGIGFSASAIDTPLSDALLLTIPVAAAGAAVGALAGRWIAGVILRRQPTPLPALLGGAGLGLVGGAFVGGIVFPLNFAIAYRLLDVPEGFWGRFDYPQAVGMAVVSGGFWGGFFGACAGAVAVPIVSLYMGF